MGQRLIDPGTAPSAPVNIDALADGTEAQGVVVRGGLALTFSAPASATVGTSSASVVSSNANRRGLVITNLSNNIVSLAAGATAVINSGICLTPHGTWNMASFDFTTGQINAVASAAGSIIAIQEMT